ncbi:Zinc finger protein [Plakobranchus ocellatus]|uniref:Zinc finger protein n=1 Tax=Plakobranchus ocellatus TaxID=259542 RepID=A0AAV4DG15_9GAST|nr:Zinc finger protein [Plakobranchus ocellatus]
MEETVKDLKFGDKLSTERRRKLEEFIGCFSSISSDRSGSTTLENHSIEMTSSTPVRQRAYSVPYAMRQTLCDALEEVENLETIRNSNFP